MDDVTAYRKRMSSYLIMKDQGGHSRAMRIKEKHPWISELAFNYSAEQYTEFEDQLTELPFCEYYPLSEKFTDKNFIKDVLNHFQVRKLDKYLEERWDEETVLAFSTSGVLRSKVFRAESPAELQASINTLIEFKTVKTLRKWIITTAHPLAKIDYNSCLQTRKLFWCIIHFYKSMDRDFDDTLSVKDWDRAWFLRAYKRMRSSAVALDSLDDCVNTCQEIMGDQRETVTKQRQLVQELRRRVITVRSRQELCIIRDMIQELQSCKSIQLLAQGFPTPPFDIEAPRAMLEKVEQELALMDFVAANEVDSASLCVAGIVPNTPPPPPVAASNSSSVENVEQLINSTASSVWATRESFMRNSKVQSILGIPCSSSLDSVDGLPRKKKPQTPFEILKLSLQVKATLRSLHQQTAECLTEIRNLVLQEVHRVLTEVKSIAEDTLQARIELQTEQYDQRRRAVRREVKRIREARETAIAQMLPFAAEQLKARAVHEQRQRAASVQKQVQALIKDAARLEERIRRATKEESALLAEHTVAQRKRMFLAAAPHYLPLAMFEPDIECGICLEVLQWRGDQGIRFVTCCPEYGYTCGACVGRPHPHAIVAEQEIVRIVRAVREGMGV